MGTVGCIGQQGGGGSNRPYLSHKGVVKPIREPRLPTFDFDPTSPTQPGCRNKVRFETGINKSPPRLQCPVHLERSSGASYGTEV